MAKCPVCDTRKGKRKCLIADNQFVCSLCCANTRKEELCLDCVFYQPPQHNYEVIPAFSATAIANKHALQQYTQAIEQTFTGDTAQDRLAILELLINKYYFKETGLATANPVWIAGFETADSVINTQLSELDEETLINLLGAIRLVTKNQLASQPEPAAHL